MAVDFAHAPSDVPIATGLLGFFLVIFGLYSAVIKERLYLSESLLTTAIGCIIGPNVIGIFNPGKWVGVNAILLEISRLIIALQIMAAVINLPVQYYRTHWKSIAVLLLPVMIVSWLLTAAFIYAIFGISFAFALLLGAMMAPTDPILANSIVKGSFADRHVPRHVRHLLSGESACNDSTAAFFIWIALYIEKYGNNAGAIAKEFVLWIVLYEMVLGVIFGVLVGMIARRALAYSKLHDLIDQENFLSFAIALALFTDGVAVLLHLNDFVAVLMAAIAFCWDGYFYEETKSSQIQEVLDNLANTWVFVFFGALIPWGTIAWGAVPFWKYIVTALLILAFRRLPVTFAVYPILPSLTSPLEALFVGHFGPIAVGTLYYMAYVRTELGADVFPELEPIATFVVFGSIVVHGMTVPLFKIGSVAVRTLSAGSSRGFRSSSMFTRVTARAPPSGTGAISGPINARPLHAPAATQGGGAAQTGRNAGSASGDGFSSTGEGDRSSEDKRKLDLPYTASPMVRETTIEIREAVVRPDVRTIFSESEEDGRDSVEADDRNALVASDSTLNGEAKLSKE